MLIDHLECIETKKNNLREFSRVLKSFFIEKDDEIETMLVAAVAGEPLLLVGDPGTAKSELVLKFVQLLGLDKIPGTFFEYLLTRFTEPSEVFGPVNIFKLKEEGVFHRNTTGKLPEARIAFLDEIFKANSAILNTLLTILNEKKFYQGGQPLTVPLEVLFGATNSIVFDTELEAFKDRFTLKVRTRSVAESLIPSLINKGLKNESADRSFNEVASTEDISDVGAFLRGQWSQSEHDFRVFMGEGILGHFMKALSVMRNDMGIFISDRKIVKIFKVLRTHAFLFGNGMIEKETLGLMRYIGNEDADFEQLEFFMDEMLERI